MTDEERAQARVGLTLRNKYTLERLLGFGGMGAVYAATHRNRKKFAIKMLHSSLSTNVEVRERFLREGRVANTVAHSGAVAVLDDDVAEDGSAFLVMELLEGTSVDDLWQQRGLSLRGVLALAEQLLDVLDAAHGKGIVHRDLKPANMFITSDGVVKVLDFGIARLREPQLMAATKTGAAMGTPGFMAPEQALGEGDKLDGLADGRDLVSAAFRAAASPGRKCAAAAGASCHAAGSVARQCEPAAASGSRACGRSRARL
jgi:eukaryotic-like serine/threonine-protein kinase